MKQENINQKESFCHTLIQETIVRYYAFNSRNKEEYETIKFFLEEE